MGEQELYQKSSSIDQVYQCLIKVFPGFFVPKLSKRKIKLLNNQTISSSEKKEIMKKYIRKLAEFQYLIQD